MPYFFRTSRKMQKCKATWISCKLWQVSWYFETKNHKIIGNNARLQGNTNVTQARVAVCVATPISQRHLQLGTVRPPAVTLKILATKYRAKPMSQNSGNKVQGNMNLIHTLTTKVQDNRVYIKHWQQSTRQHWYNHKTMATKYKAITIMQTFATPGNFTKQHQAVGTVKIGRKPRLHFAPAYVSCELWPAFTEIFFFLK